VPLVAVIVQYNFYHSILEHKSRSLAGEKLLGVEERVATWLASRGRTVEFGALAVQKDALDDEAVRAQLGAILQADSHFSSLYFVTRDNKMINATNFVPPPGLDFRLRPWYVQAAQAGKLIMTEVFLNSTGDDYIVSMAVPVIGTQGELLGVVSGDISLATIISFVEQSKVTPQSHVFLADGPDLVAYSHPSGDFTPEEALSIYEWLVAAFPAPNREVSLTRLRGYGGYFARWPVAGTNWVLSAFVPEADVAVDTSMLRRVIYGLLASLLAMAALFVYMQQRYVVRPIVQLAEGISRIDVENAPAYRLSASDKHATAQVVSILNGLLGRLDSYLHHRRESELAQRELNASLETAMQRATEHHAEILRQQEYWRALFANSQDAIVVLDAEHYILEVNDAFSALFGYLPAEARGRNLETLVASHKLEEASALTWNMTQGLTCGVESTRLHKDGHEIEVEIKGLPVLVDNHILGGYAIYSDIAVRKEQERKITRMSYFDQLTNVHNRAYFDHVFVELSAHGPWPFSLIMGDTNGLKVVNDAFGHALGDEILRRTAQVLAEVARPQDTVARLGGDEFALLLPGVGEEEVMAICARIRERCQENSDSTIQLSLALAQVSTAPPKNARKAPLFESKTIGSAGFTFVKVEM